MITTDIDLTSSVDDLETLTEWASIDPEAAFESICEAGRIEQADEDDRAWRIGDLACLVGKVYGENRIDKFAKSINSPVPTVKQKRQMSAFYEKDTRYLFPNLSRSHYRAAMSLKPLGAAILLTEASDNSWTVEQTALRKSEVLGKVIPPEKLLDAVGQVAAVKGNMLYIQLEDGCNPYELAALVQKAIQVKVYEVAA